MNKKSFFNLLSLVLFFFLQISSVIVAAERSKIAIISLYDHNYKHIGQYSDTNKTQYANKNGYDLFLYHESLDNTRPGAWSKILAIQNHLKDYEWIYWSDADSLIMNMQIKLEDIIDDKFNLIISRESGTGNLNTGSFLLKNCDWSEKLLKILYDQTDFINHCWWEQAALAHLFDIEPSLLEHVKILHQRVLNSNIKYPEPPDGLFEAGDFVIHFYGGWDKEALMREWSTKVIYN